ncbi:MAG: SPOR domain-containing protein [Legionellales bacterium]|nr:SPOR domain-containing protein [Legionellales bacterium]
MSNNTFLWFPLALILMLFSLSSCTVYDEDYYRWWNNGNNPGNYNSQYRHNTMDLPSANNRRTQSRRSRGGGSGGVRVPDSYHFSEQATPVSHKNRDTGWVRSQKPGNYTIELDSGEKPAEVANTLHKAPKNTRKAQVKQRKNGKTVYTGVYGSFENEEQARRAMKDLPEDVRSKAKVRRWDKVQEKTDAPPTPTPPEVKQPPEVERPPQDDAPHSFLPPEPDPPIYPIF